MRIFRDRSGDRRRVPACDSFGRLRRGAALAIARGASPLVATNATVGQILTEWARVGQTKIVNVERIPGGPLTLQLTDVPERRRSTCCCDR